MPAAIHKNPKTNPNTNTKKRPAPSSAPSGPTAKKARPQSRDTAPAQKKRARPVVPVVEESDVSDEDEDEQLVGEEVMDDELEQLNEGMDVDENEEGEGERKQVKDPNGTPS